MSTATFAGGTRRRGLPVTLRLAWRELRGGLRGFYVFVACITLGVMTIAGVGSFAESLGDGLAREGRVILGGDLSFSLIQREATADERAFLDGLGRVSAVATMRSMVRTANGRSALVEAKAVDGDYPLYGSVVTTPAGRLPDLLAARGDTFGAVADPTLLSRLGLKTGDVLTLGGARLELRAALAAEPDKLAGGLAFGPRLLVSEVALRASGLLQPGSLVRWHYRVGLPAGQARDEDVGAATTAAANRFPQAGWDVRTRTNASPTLERDVERFTQYLTLVGLTALLVGGVGVANSVRYHLDRRRNVIAVMKSLGAGGARVFLIHLFEVVLLALLGIGLGLLLGAALPFVAAAAVGQMIPLPIAPALHGGQLLAAFAYGLLTAVAFAIWPLGRAHDVTVAALFRDQIAPERRLPRARYVIATIGALAALALLAVGLAFDRRIAVIFVAAAAAVFLLLWVVARLLMWAARHAPRARSTVLRLAIANIHRPGALTATVVLSLGLGLALLVTVMEIDGNLRRQFAAALPDRAPSFYFLDIQPADVDRFDAFVRREAPHAILARVPMLRGRIVDVNGVKAEDLKPPQNVAWVLQSDRGITYTGEVPAGSRVVAGQWWGPDYDGPPLVSFEARIARGLGLQLGDPITVNVLGRNITAHVSNLRAVDWESLGINFVMVFSPSAFRGAPLTHIATLTYPGGGSAEEEGALLNAVAGAFPTVTVVRVKEALDSLGTLVSNLLMAIRGASAITLLSAALVLGGALAAGHRHRVYDAVVLKTVGARRRDLIAAFVLEYLMLGIAAAVFGVAAGSVAAWRITVDVMSLGFIWQPGPAAFAVLGALAVTIGLGLVGTFAALGRKPASVLRNL
ncbi:MAG TPA: FtsX-like permease family protein [Xanthobacteraceae bacterium]|nr:FtsX-like permease family protein [Xanthobacteraceae bacterium]